VRQRSYSNHVAVALRHCVYVVSAAAAGTVVEKGAIVTSINRRPRRAQGIRHQGGLRGGHQGASGLDDMKASRSTWRSWRWPGLAWKDNERHDRNDRTWIIFVRLSPPPSSVWMMSMILMWKRENSNTTIIIIIIIWHGDMSEIRRWLRCWWIVTITD